ncbi:hypothetical protein C0991_002553, partial [Blastosporella zonata]
PLVLVDRTLDTERQTFEPPESAEDDTRDHAEHDPLRLGCVATGREHEVVKHVREHQDGEIQSWELSEHQQGTEEAK